jgi:hypothetical protein
MSTLIAKLTPMVETGAWLIRFVTLGKYLEAYTRGETTGALRTLMKLQPVSATLAVLPWEVVVELNRIDHTMMMEGGATPNVALALLSSSLLSKIDLNSVPMEERDITEVSVGGGRFDLNRYYF